MNIRQIEKEADRIIEEFGITNGPVPVDMIAAQKGLQLRSFDDLGEDVSGLLVVKGESGTIGFNSTESKVRQRFTIAHELGHFVLHADQPKEQIFIDHNAHFYYRDSFSSAGVDKQEQQANAFAAALLMPSKLLMQEIQTHHFDLSDDSSLKQLADQFNVSSRAMTYRIDNLQKYFPNEFGPEK